MAGGYTTAGKEVVALLRQKARPYLFSNAVAPPVAGASLEALRLLQRDTSLPDALAANTKYFRAAMEEVHTFAIALTGSWFTGLSRVFAAVGINVYQSVI